jgi:hypothetical protein
LFRVIRSLLLSHFLEWLSPSAESPVINWWVRTLNSNCHSVSTATRLHSRAERTHLSPCDKSLYTNTGCADLHVTSGQNAAPPNAE